MNEKIYPKEIKIIWFLDPQQFPFLREASGGFCKGETPIMTKKMKNYIGAIEDNRIIVGLAEEDLRDIKVGRPCSYRYWWLKKSDFKTYMKSKDLPIEAVNPIEILLNYDSPGIARSSDENPKYYETVVKKRIETYKPLERLMDLVKKDTEVWKKLF